jgi:DNA-binding NtrC family response regulator
VVDDEQAVAKGLAALFRKRGYVVCVALTGRSAMDAVRETRVDGAIIDFRIPDMRGDVLYAALIAIQPDLASRVVFLSGDVTDVVAEALSDTGCPIVLKPFEMVEFERVVAETIGPVQPEDGAADALN